MLEFTRGFCYTDMLWPLWTLRHKIQHALRNSFPVTPFKQMAVCMSLRGSSVQQLKVSCIICMQRQLYKCNCLLRPNHESWHINPSLPDMKCSSALLSSYVKQAKTPMPRPRPKLWGRGPGWGQVIDAEATSHIDISGSTYGEGVVFRGEPCPTSRRRGSSTPSFWGSFLFMRTPFVAELPHFTW